MAYATQQPVATPGMVVSNGNRNVKNLPVEADGREWSNGLFDCFADAGTCEHIFLRLHIQFLTSTIGLVAWCFPCVIYSKNLKRYEHLNTKGIPDPENGGGIFNGDCVTHGCLTLCGCGWVMQVGLLEVFYPSVLY